MFCEQGLENEWTDENEHDSSQDSPKCSPKKKRKSVKDAPKTEKTPKKISKRTKGKKVKIDDKIEMNEEFEDDKFHDLKDLEQTLEAVAASYFGAVSVNYSKKVKKTSEASKSKRTSKGAVTVPLVSLRKWLEVADSKLSPIAKEHLLHLKSGYGQWSLEMACGFNVLLYGFGSKKLFLDEFCEEILMEKDYCFVKIYGYKPSFDLKNMLISLFEGLKLCLPVDSSPSSLADALAYAYSSNDSSLPELIIIIHNIDGVSLRNNNAQNVLATLCAIPKIHVIASVDHPNITILWDNHMLQKFNWVWHECTTFACYKDELTCGDSKMLGLSSGGTVGGHTLASLESVWASLTKNSRRIFVVLVEEVFAIVSANMKKQNSIRTNTMGVDFWKIYKKCHSDFLVSNETNFERQLVEFIDHRLITRKNVDSCDTLNICVDLRVLNDFMVDQGIEVTPLQFEGDNLLDLENALDEFCD